MFTQFLQQHRETGQLHSLDEYMLFATCTKDHTAVVLGKTSI